MSPKPKIDIFLMSYNRPNYVLATLKSILDQTYKNFRLIVSENSSDDQVQKLIKDQFPQIEIRRRRPSVSMSQHWNIILSEVEADYFMMFHDDDLLLPEGLENLVQTINSHEKAVAVSGNAFIISGLNETGLKFNKDDFDTREFLTVADFGLRYFNPRLGGVNPFPGYLYRNQLVQPLRFNPNEAGKHSDVSFLFKCLQKGSIVWLAKPTIKYRIHASNDSVGVDLLDLVKLTGLYVKFSKAKKNIFVQEFKLKNHVLAAKQQGLLKVFTRRPKYMLFLLKSLSFFYLAHPSLLLGFVRAKLSKLG